MVWIDPGRDALAEVKKVRCAGHRVQGFLTMHLVQSLPVEVADVQIGSVDDQQGRAGEFAQRALAAWR